MDRTRLFRRLSHGAVPHRILQRRTHEQTTKPTNQPTTTCLVVLPSSKRPFLPCLVARSSRESVADDPDANPSRRVPARRAAGGCLALRSNPSLAYRRALPAAADGAVAVRGTLGRTHVPKSISWSAKMLAERKADSLKKAEHSRSMERDIDGDCDDDCAVVVGVGDGSLIVSCRVVSCRVVFCRILWYCDLIDYSSTVGCVTYGD
eukprot:CAMPEP_0168242666 /NCGR_PEP_ID=MMETSP0140_2-20121125/23574_1 /TAXON_ID=44445 /ORGANISM="Pseudo-nitzschia australis, Strain 10249 10 AB" /LENGTH=205 /DNA_ID=CAMNT_0008177847 /DNA_START=144 /DNA_END=761 /DNA_ORIENTATION=-